MLREGKNQQLEYDLTSFNIGSHSILSERQTVSRGNRATLLGAETNVSPLWHAPAPSPLRVLQARAWVDSLR